MIFELMQLVRVIPDDKLMKLVLFLFLRERMRMTTYKRKGSRGFAVFALITTEATSLQFPYMN